MRTVDTRTRGARVALAALGAVAVTLTAGGCGSLGERDGEQPTLATVRGTLTTPDGVSLEGELRVALLWRVADYEPMAGKPFRTSQDVAVAAELPASFTLELTAPPPADTLVKVTAESDSDFPPGAAYAQASLVVYDDRDLDGELDLLAPGANAPVDVVLGWRPDIEIWYVTGPLPDPEQDGAGWLAFLVHGYQIVLWGDGGGQLVEAVEIPLSEEPDLAGLDRLVCEDPFDPPTRIVDVWDALPDPIPATDGNAVWCMGPDALVVDSCRAVVAEYLCPPTSPLDCQATSYHLPDPANPPEGWPCGQ